MFSSTKNVLIFKQRLAKVTQYLATVYIEEGMRVAHGQSMFYMCLIKKLEHDAQHHE